MKEAICSFRLVFPSKNKLTKYKQMAIKIIYTFAAVKPEYL